MTATTPPSSEEILSGLREIINAVLNEADRAEVDSDALGPETPLLSLPLDSVRLIEAMTHIEDRFRIYIPEQQAFAFTTVGEVVEYVRQRSMAKLARGAAKGAQE